MVTGKSPADPAFRKQRTEFLRRFADALGARRPYPTEART
jgi:hypothetical protein